MAIDPDTQAVLDLIRLAGRPPFETLAPGEARQAYAASRKLLQPPPEDVAESRDTTVPGSLGPIGVRLYRPAGTAASDVLPALIWYHGGGWLLGDLDSHDVPCRRFANATRCRVISVDYRMAPEHVFPAAVNDCATVTKYVFDNAAALGVDASKVAVGGDSAGGNLAAVMALMSRDGTLPPIAFQLLVYPATDMTMTTVSSTTIGPGVPLTSATIKFLID
jgi:acetyl esterase